MTATDKPISLVTGANKGIGLEVCRRLGALGHVVLVGARDKKRGRNATDELKAAGIDAHLLLVDVTHQPSIDRTADYIGQEYGRLDVLVNNAGIIHDRSLTAADIPLDTIREVFEPNFFGAIAVTQAMLPLLRKSAGGRIVNMSSALGSLTMQSDPANPFGDYKLLGYDASKTALNAVTVHFAYLLRDTPIKINSASPGWVKTEMGGPEAPGSVEEGADTPVWLATLPADGPSGGFFQDRQSIPW
jgi:NAD(P)-dependent dehydrogenase (short-subunit alcohol dehydrogenase family)